MVFDSNTARQGQAKSAAVRRYRKRDPLTPVRRALPELFKELLAAARGVGAWKDLPAEKRLAALTKAIEYGIGRPISVDKLTKPEEPDDGEGPESASGIVIA